MLAIHLMETAMNGISRGDIPASLRARDARTSLGGFVFTTWGVKAHRYRLS
jgi:hypothetical protein